MSADAPPDRPNADVPWYEAWFDRAEYELVYRHRDAGDAARLLGLLDRALPTEPGNAILDMGCGRGRHAIALARRGYRGTGVDIAPSAIEKATAAARERRLCYGQTAPGNRIAVIRR